jgi:hypothetical protein
MLATTNGRAFWIARDRDLIIEVDPSCGHATHSTSLASLAPSDPASGARRPANPHDAAAAPDGTVVVPLYTAAKLAFVKDGMIESIDLSSYDPDGNPQADAVRVLDIDGAAKAFVTLERLDDNRGLRSRQPSQMLRVDVATRTVEAVVDLAGRNPFNVMAELDGSLFLAEPGNFDTVDEDEAGIERFDARSSIARILVSERQLGASVTEVAVTRGCGAAIIASPEPGINRTSVITFDPETGQLFTTREAPLLGPTPGYDLQGLAWRGGKLYVGDRRRGAKGYTIHVLERSHGCALTNTGRTLDVPQRPVALRATHDGVRAPLR